MARILISQSYNQGEKLNTMKNQLVLLTVALLFRLGLTTGILNAASLLAIDENTILQNPQPAEANLSFNNSVQTVNLVLIGIVVDKKTLLPVEGIRVEVEENNSGSRQWFNTKQDGNFYFKLESDKEYKLSAINKNGEREDNKIISTDNKRKSEILRAVLQITVPEVKSDPVVAEYKIEKSNPTSTANHNIVFKIQLGAFRQPMSTKSPFYTNVSDDFKFEIENTTSGYIRYMVGSFKDIAKAKEEETKFHKKGYNKAFIVPYVNNQRQSISVEEVLKKYGSK